MKSLSLRKILCLLSILLVSVILTAQSVQLISAATVKKQTVQSSTVRQSKQFTLVNMPYNNEKSIISEYKGEKLKITTVQNFDYTPDGKYIFTVGECTANGKRHGLLSRCALPSEAVENATAECLEAVVLDGFGHSDVLAVTQDNLKKQVYSIWVSCKPGSDGVGRQIARLTYQVSKSGKGKITKTVYIKGFEKTNVVKGKAAYYKDKVKAEWVHCAVDTSGNSIVFRLKLPSGYGCVYLSYDFKKINSALNKLKNNATLNISSKPTWQKARVSCPITPLCSFQSFTVKDNTLYIAGGNLGLGAQIYVIDYKTYKDGKIRELDIRKESQLTEIITVDPLIKIDDALYDRNYLEIEGIKVTQKKGKIYYHVSFNCIGPSPHDTAGIYKFSAD